MIKYSSSKSKKKITHSKKLRYTCSCRRRRAALWRPSSSWGINWRRRIRPGHARLTRSNYNSRKRCRRWKDSLGRGVMRAFRKLLISYPRSMRNRWGNWEHSLHIASCIIAGVRRNGKHKWRILYLHWTRHIVCKINRKIERQHMLLMI